MPGSVRENNVLVRNFALDENIQSVLDIGPGQGTYSDILWDLVPTMDAIEIWEPYIERYQLRGKYRKVINADVRTKLLDINEHYDLIVFGDVLEHMSEAEAIAVWNLSSLIATWGLISVPIIHYPQGAEEGNPYEEHVQDHLTPERVRELYGPFDVEGIFPVTGTFIRRFTGVQTR